MEVRSPFIFSWLLSSISQLVQHKRIEDEDWFERTGNIDLAILAEEVNQLCMPIDDLIIKELSRIKSSDTLIRQNIIWEYWKQFLDSSNIIIMFKWSLYQSLDSIKSFLLSGFFYFCHLLLQLSELRFTAFTVHILYEKQFIIRSTWSVPIDKDISLLIYLCSYISVHVASFTKISSLI
jgi:hypothetical protein